MSVDLPGRQHCPSCDIIIVLTTVMWHLLLMWKEDRRNGDRLLTLSSMDSDDMAHPLMCQVVTFSHCPSNAGLVMQCCHVVVVGGMCSGGCGQSNIVWLIVHPLWLLHRGWQHGPWFWCEDGNMAPAFCVNRESGQEGSRCAPGLMWTVMMTCIVTVWMTWHVCWHARLSPSAIVLLPLSWWLGVAMLPVLLGVVEQWLCEVVVVGSSGDAAGGSGRDGWWWWLSRKMVVVCWWCM